MAKRVLVVDDDECILGLISTVLEEEGYQVQTASNGYEGLKAVERNMPDLILLDLNMPVMDGSTFYKEFRTKYGDKVSCVLMTAATDGRKWADEMGGGGDIGFIPKPFNLRSLLRVIGNYLPMAILLGLGQR